MTYIQPTGSPSAWTTLDLSAGSETNVGMKGGTTVLGASSTLQVAATHGLPDAGLDCYANLQSIGAVPAGKRILLVRTTCATGPTEDPGGNSAWCHVAIGSVNNLQTGKAYYAGFARNFAALNHAAGPNTVGNAPSSITVIGDPAPFTSLIQVTFDSATQSTGISQQCYGDNGAIADVGQNTGNITPYTDVYLGVFLSQTAATPASVVTWGGVVIQYQWV